jgi:hypothetical protein
MEKFTKGKKKMTTDSQGRDLERSHNKRKEDAKTVGKQKRMSDEYFDREMVEIKLQLNILEQLLQEKIREDLKYGVNVKEKSQMAC